MRNCELFPHSTISAMTIRLFPNCCFRSLICGSAFDSAELAAGQARYIAHSRQDAARLPSTSSGPEPVEGSSSKSAPTAIATELRKRSTRQRFQISNWGNWGYVFASLTLFGRWKNFANRHLAGNGRHGYSQSSSRCWPSSLRISVKSWLTSRVPR